MSGRQRLGVSTLPSAVRSRYALPSHSILSPGEPGRAPLERSKALQTFIDCLSVVGLALFLCVTAVSVPVSIFLLLFASF